MAKQTATSGLAGKLGGALDAAILEHKDDELKLPGGGSLPPGIDHGIAQLKDVKFDVYKEGDNKGQYYFYAAGVVVEPKKVGNIPVEGLRTSIIEPMCATPKATTRKTIPDHTGWVLNIFRMLGVDTKGVTTGAQLEAIAAALKKSQPYFRFRTWQGKPTPQYPDPRVNETWSAKVDYEAGGEEHALDGDVVDSSPPAETEEVQEQHATDNGAGQVEATAAPADLASLGEAADGGDADAAGQLTELAKAAGIDPEAYETWSEVATLLGDNGGSDGNGGTDPEAAAGEPSIPKKEEIYFYTPPGKRKAIECEVTAVFEKSEKVNLKSLDDGTSYKSVEWKALKES